MNKKRMGACDDFSRNTPEIENIIGYHFKDKSLLIQAFTRTSFCNEHSGADSLPYQSNEVLEFFGDGVLSAAIISIFMKDLSERYSHGIKTDLGEGDFSNIKSRLSDKKNLSDRIEELGLYKYLRMGEGDKKLGIEKEPSVMEDLFESIIGAVYIDCGMDIRTVISVVSRMLDVKKYLLGATRDKNSTVSAPIQSYKNALQEWCADKRRRLPAPVYKTVSESGPDHKKVYERACFIGDKQYSVGVGKNQKLADADAAEKTLHILMKEESASVSKKESESSPKKKEQKDTKAPKIEKRLTAHTLDKDAEAKLKAHAKTSHLASPVFRDMGETEQSTNSNREYSVLCRLDGKEAIGIGADKSAARLAAADGVLNMIVKEREEKKREKADFKQKAHSRVKKTNDKIDKRREYRKGVGKK